MTENFGDFESIEFAENPDPRVPVAIVLDCSDSMQIVRDGETRSPLEALNASLDTLVYELNKDPLAKRRVEITFVPYGSTVAPASDFKTVDELVLPELTPMGVTSTGAALEEALNAIDARKRLYKTNGVQYYRPWVMLITDGLATDDVSKVTSRIADGEGRKSFSFFAVGVEGADMNALNNLAPRGALPLQGVKFEELFQWLSASQSNVSASQPEDDKVGLPSPAGWMEV